MKNKRLRNAVHRVALYLKSINIEPILEGHSYNDYYRALMRQYCALSREARQEARRRGRLLFRTIGLKASSAALVPAPPPIPPGSHPKSHYREAVEVNGLSRSCRSWGGRPKRVFTTEKEAQDFCARQKDPLLFAFACPAACGPAACGGGFHVGHRKPDSMEPCHST